jgi:hypothetical protein
VKGNKTPASQPAMPIPIIIAILIALFTLGAKVNQQKDHPAKVVILGGKQYNWVDEKDNRNTLDVKAPQQDDDHTIIIKGQRQSAPFENIFQLSGLYQIIKAEPITPVNHSFNSNMKQAVYVSVK